MATSPEFVHDTDSPANGISTHLLRIVQPEGAASGSPKHLMKWPHAAEWARHLAIEPGSVTRIPGIRVLRLWFAQADDLSCLPVETARKRELRPFAHFLATATESGRLVVSSCLRYGRDSEALKVPDELWGLDDSEPVARDAIIKDMGLVDGRDLLENLVVRHRARAQHYRASTRQEANPAAVDLPLALLLRNLPESTQEFFTSKHHQL